MCATAYVTWKGSQWDESNFQENVNFTTDHDWRFKSKNRARLAKRATSWPLFTEKVLGICMHFDRLYPSEIMWRPLNGSELLTISSVTEKLYIFQTQYMPHRHNTFRASWERSTYFIETIHQNHERSLTINRSVKKRRSLPHTKRSDGSRVTWSPIYFYITPLESPISAFEWVRRKETLNEWSLFNFTSIRIIWLAKWRRILFSRL